MTKKSFHLRWNNHLQNLQSLFENLYNEQSLVDVTISCTDGLLYGHKLVLSACSPYFEQVFRDNPCKHPILILKGIKRVEMQILLEYMYIGSVDVGEEDLEMLLDTATELQIKGLVQCSEKSPYPSNQSKKIKKTHYAFQNSENNVIPTSLNPKNTDDIRWQGELETSQRFIHIENESLSNKHNNSRHSSTEEISQNSQMMLQHHETNLVSNKSLHPDHEISRSTAKEEYIETSEEETKDYSQGEVLEESSENMQINYNFQENKTSESDDGNLFCPVCNRGFQNKASHQRHMLTHTGVKPHSCTFCSQSFLRLSHLQRHIRVHTGERPYSCTQCPRQFARSDKLRQHYIIQHNETNGSKISKPRGRPRKNHNLFAPSTSSGSDSIINSVYSISMNSMSTSAV